MQMLRVAAYRRNNLIEYLHYYWFCIFVSHFVITSLIKFQMIVAITELKRVFMQMHSETFTKRSVTI